jgi:hypothetical protein
LMIYRFLMDVCILLFSPFWCICCG